MRVWLRRRLGANADDMLSNGMVVASVPSASGQCSYTFQTKACRQAKRQGVVSLYPSSRNETGDWYHMEC
jgi:hypothetical protein